MSYPPTSLVAVGKLTVQHAATNLIASIKANRAKERQDWIERIASTGRGLWPRRRHYTIEQATAIVDGPPRCWSDNWHRATWWRDTGARWIELGEHLLCAVELSQDGYIWLNLKDAKTVSDYLK